VASTIEQVIPLLHAAEEAARAGSWVALALSYEAAPAFDSALKVKKSSEFPLAWMGVFAEPSTLEPDANPGGTASLSEWEPRMSKREYQEGIQSIRSYIEAGDTYQVNFTFPLFAHVAGDSFGWFRTIARTQGAAYSAYLDIGTHTILSFSPELFVERRGRKLITRPMKGTLARGRWLEEDRLREEQLRLSPKDRAENVMIVDLLRSDLGKIAETGSVEVEDLFSVEYLNRVLQMTSTITATQSADVTVTDILRALFPCGSVTGAPKARTMAIIEELEQHPRGIYTGAIGLIRPNGDAMFSVPIRTLVVDHADCGATFGVGGGITWESTSEGEYEECRLKAKFLTDPWEDFELLETMALKDGVYDLLHRHIARAHSSARYFGFRWNDAAISRAIDDTRRAYPLKQWRIRLLIGRNGEARTEVSPLGGQRTAPLAVKFASRPVDDRDPLLFHKTTARARYDIELERCRPCDDVIFWNDRGEVTESTIANVVVYSEGKHWTPPREAGLLAGTFREELISKGDLFVRTITKEELAAANSFSLVNSVRGWMPAMLVTDHDVALALHNGLR
jgi:para-aminobenzoate synthetase/4-amino-4-deoxychorismate lyase